MAKQLDTIKARFAPGWPAWIECNEGWWPILLDLDEKLAEVAPNFQYNQIKEKFGGLRVYICDSLLDETQDWANQNVWDVANKLIKEAEQLAYKTCEMCGEPGRMRDRSWVRTLCDGCAK